MPIPHSVQQVTLTNKAEGLLIDVPGASVMCYEFDFRAGNEFVARKEIQQTAHILEHMAFKACKQYPSAESFSQAFSRNGAYSNATTWETNMSYYGDCADIEWKRILDLQRQALVEPLFLLEEFEAEKRNVREELTGQGNNHNRIMWQHISRAMGGTSFLDKEKIATIDAVTLEDIREHHKRTHTTTNLRFVIAGNLEGRHDDIISQLEAWKLPKGRARLSPRQEPTHRGELVAIERSDMDSLKFGLAIDIQRKITRNEELHISALNHILNGTFHSRMFGRARSRGLCYNMGSDVGVDQSGTSSWTFGGQVTESNARELMELIITQLQEVAEGRFTDTEIEDAILFGIGSYQKSNQTVGALAGYYGADYFADDMIYSLDSAVERIRAISRETMTSVAREFLQSGVWGFGVIGNVSEPIAQELETVVAKAFA